MRRVDLNLKNVLLAVLGVVLMWAPLPEGSLGADRLRSASAGEEATFALEIGPKDMPIEEFLRAVAEKTGRAFVWNPSDKNIRGKKIIGNVRLKGDSKQFFSLARSLLTFYELVMIPVGPNGDDILLIMDARATSSILKLKPKQVVLTDENLADYEHEDGLFIAATIRVEHMEELRNARNALTRLVTGQNIGSVTEVPSARAFVVRDFAPNVVAIYRTLKEMDVPDFTPSAATGTTVAVTLQHADAPELAETLTQHYAVPARVGRAPRTPGTTAPKAPRITASKRTNQLLLTGNESQIAQLREAVALLDIPVAQPPEAAHLVRLGNIAASEAAAALGLWIEISNLWASDGRRPSVVAHAETNTLLVSATEADFVTLQAIIEDLDVKQAKEAGQ